MTIRLLKEADYEQAIDLKISYNHHFAPSNSFYINLGGKVRRKDIQGNAQLVVDVFVFCLEDLKQTIQELH